MFPFLICFFHQWFLNFLRSCSWSGTGSLGIRNLNCIGIGPTAHHWLIQRQLWNGMVFGSLRLGKGSAQSREQLDQLIGFGLVIVYYRLWLMRSSQTSCSRFGHFCSRMCTHFHSLYSTSLLGVWLAHSNKNFVCFCLEKMPSFPQTPRLAILHSGQEKVRLSLHLIRRWAWLMLLSSRWTKDKL